MRQAVSSFARWMYGCRLEETNPSAESIPLRPAVGTRYTAIPWFEVGDDMHGRGRLPRLTAATSDLDYNGLRLA